ncbi:MAG: arginine--tRNA ligase [Micavibrio sp.]
MTSLTQKLSDIAGKAFEEAGLEHSCGLVRVSDRPDLAQFQCNGAMAAAKAAKKNPREIATQIAASLSQNAAFKKVEIAGPGFINLNITDEYLKAHIESLMEDDRAGMADIGANEMILLDYGGPNIAKAMHVGHLRAAIIGDSMRRILGFAGFKVLGDVHLGDWGTNIGILIDNYIESNETSLLLDADTENAADVARLVDDMAERYPRATAIAKEEPDVMTRARSVTVKLQNKEEPYYSIWEKIRAISIYDIKRNYDALGVVFDLWKGEADVHDYIAPMVEDLKEKSFAFESEGAWVVPVARNDDKKEMPPLILYKRDGGVMYGTTDLATIIERVKLYKPAKIIYIVDQRQGLHFEQVFRAARIGGIAPDSMELTHAGFGTMNGPDGKPFKTRAGGVMRLDDLISMAQEKALARMEEANIAKDISGEEKQDIANKVAIAAIKFADLQGQRQADYVFDLDRLTEFEGKTGPYLLYQAVRIKSLLRKAGYKKQEEAALVLHDADRPLALMLGEFPDAIEAAARNYAPHYLCDYIYRLAQSFSSFYGNCHILSEQDGQLKASRLALCAQTCHQLELALGLLGIEVPERM